MNCNRFGINTKAYNFLKQNAIPEAKCNSTWNLETERYYQILAEDDLQAKSIAKQTYAEEFHVKEYFVDVKL